MSDLDARLRSLEGWKRDAAAELRELEEWREHVSPFLETLEADLIYRQRRHAEQVGNWSTGWKIVAALLTILVALATVGGFVVELILLSRSVHGG